jgi:hypothetical protein
VLIAPQLLNPKVLKWLKAEEPKYLPLKTISDPKQTVNEVGGQLKPGLESERHGWEIQEGL